MNTFKIKMVLWGVIVFCLTACSDYGWTDDRSETEENVGNLYMAINLTSNQSSTRAIESDDDSTYDEDKIYDKKYIYLFFFDSEGNAVPITDEGKNFVNGDDLLVKEDSLGELDYSQLSVVLKGRSLTTAPRQVVALINCINKTFTEQTYDLYTLRHMTDIIPLSSFVDPEDSSRSLLYFTMSNSAYHDGTKPVYATEIEPSQLADSAEEAQNHPVNIFVERMVTKITIDTYDHNYNKIPLKDVTVQFEGDSETTPLYLWLYCWSLVNLPNKTYLIKELDGFNETLGTTNTVKGVTAWEGWSVPSEHYCSWSVVPEDLSFSETKITWNYHLNVYGYWYIDSGAYSYENTLQKEEDKDNLTKIVIGGVIGDESGLGQLSFAYWEGKYYHLGNSWKTNLKQVMADILGARLFSYDSTGGTWTAISASDVDFYVLDDGYHVKPKVINGTTWYPNNSTTPYTEAEVKEITDEIPEAMIWNYGMCYYIIDLMHDTGVGKLYGMVRNHWYKLIIQNITGLGTPVYDPDLKFTPVRVKERSTTSNVKTTLSVKKL